MTKPIDPRQMFFHEFEPLVGEVFLADCNPQPAELVLEQAQPLRMTGAILRPQFTLIFSSTSAILLVAGTYSLRCGQFGPAMIAISPISPPAQAKPDRQYYQAAFS